MSDILIIQAARFGDLVQTKRLVLGLASGRRIHLAVDHGLTSLAKILYPLATVHGLTFHGQLDTEKLAANEAVLHQLDEIDFTAIYNCNFSHLTDAICRNFPRERVFFYRPAIASAGGLLRSPWARLGFRLSAMREATPLNLVDYWGYAKFPPAAPEAVNPPAIPGGRGIGIAVAGREERRSIPVEALAGAARTAFRHFHMPPIYLFGTPGEMPRARKLLRLFDGPMLNATTNLCGKTPWEELVPGLAGLDLLITPDTGLMHLAAHLGVPVLALFLSSAWCHETGPYGLGHTIFQAAPPCSPCLESAPCSHNLRCHKIFLRTDFTRCVGEALDRILPLPWPDGLQLWKSGLDDLGASPVLLRGYDKNEGIRQAARSIVKCRAGLSSGPENINLKLMQKLVPESEWMLPPWRYC